MPQPHALISAALATLENMSPTDERLSTSARENIVQWLTEPRYARYAAMVAEHIDKQQWKVLDDVFFKVIPFGTGGRRGKMYPIGSNAVNDRTIGESAAGLAAHVKEVVKDQPLSCAIAYDSRHNSRHFAELCARIMAAADFKIFFLDEIRSTPELSFLVRYKQCTCGIMVTASHNPPSDNAVKVYWSTGGQILPPHDKQIIEKVMNVGEINDDVDFAAAVREGKIEICNEEVDAAFLATLAHESFPGPRDLKIIYSPLHGVGESAVVPLLQEVGFPEVEVFAPQREPNGDFPNVPGHVANPENPAVFEALIARGQEVQADLAMATDPDCDRLGVAAPLSRSAKGPWETFTGNQIGALLADYVLESRKKAGTLSPQHYLIKTLVTTEMVRRIADSYGVRTEGNLHVGFKWIGGKMDEAGPDKFLFACEESHGYLVGQHARDKDGVVATMLMASLAAKLKSQKKTLHEKLDDLYWQHGYHREELLDQKMEGSAGMEAMAALMDRFRAAPPASLGGMKVQQLRDYVNLKLHTPDGTTQPLDAPAANMVILDLAEGNMVAVRPSGTEPKVKFYLFGYVPAEQIADLQTTKEEVAEQMAGVKRDLIAYVAAI